MQLSFTGSSGLRTLGPVIDSDLELFTGEERMRRHSRPAASHYLPLWYKHRFPRPSRFVWEPPLPF